MEQIVQITTDKIRARPEVRDVFAQIGSVAGGDPFAGGGGGSLRSGTFTVVLKENCHNVALFFPGEWFGRCPRDEHRQINTVESRDAVRPLLRDIPDARVTTTSDFGGADVAVVLASDNGELLERTVEQVQREMRGPVQHHRRRPHGDAAARTRADHPAERTGRAPGRELGGPGRHRPGRHHRRHRRQHGQVLRRRTPAADPRAAAGLGPHDLGAIANLRCRWRPAARRRSRRWPTSPSRPARA
jgi:hypothetical protein